MMQVKKPVLYFFLLVLQVFFDFTPDVVNKRGRFSKILSEKCFKFVLSEESNPVPLNLNLVLLPIKVDFILKKQDRKRDALVVCGTSYIEMIFTLLTKVVILYV